MIFSTGVLPQPGRKQGTGAIYEEERKRRKIFSLQGSRSSPERRKERGGNS